MDTTEALAQAGGNLAEAARLLGVSRSTLGARVDRDPALQAVRETARAERERATRKGPTADVRGDTATVDSGGPYPEGEVPTVRELLLATGLDPEEWEEERVRTGRYGGAASPMFSVFATFRRKRPAFAWPVVPAAEPPPSARRARSRIPTGKVGKAGAGLAVFLSDPHAPYVDERLDERVDSWLHEVRPEVGVIGGDVLDLPTLSRHKRNPAYNASPQECVDAGFAWLLGKVKASPETRWTLLLGNHDQRLRDYMLDRAADAYGLRAATWPGEVPEPPEDLATMVRRLLHLDALGVEVVAPARDGEYHLAEVRLAPKLGARHGKRTGKDAGLKTAERLGYSVLFGHTHRKRTEYLTRWDENGDPSVTLALQAGCLCQVAGGLGYMDEETPDWQQGFATAQVHPGGLFHAEHALWAKDRLLWRDGAW